MKSEQYTKAVLLDVLGSYSRMIKLSAKEYPAVVLSDIAASIDSVLRTNEYSGKYVEDNGYRFPEAV